MATYDLRKKTNASTGQTKINFGGQAASLESFKELEKKAGELEKKQYELLVLKNKATFNDMDKIIELQNEINEMWAEINELADRINKLATNAKDFGLNFGEDNA